MKKISSRAHISPRNAAEPKAARSVEEGVEVNRALPRVTTLHEEKRR
jgi:hypothetical protein